MISATAYDRHVEQLFELLHRVTSALRAAGIEYRVIGGVAVFLHVAERDPLAARVTRDIDLAVDRADMEAIRNAAGVDLLVDSTARSARSAVHLVMVREKVRPDYPEPVPDFSPAVETSEGVLLAPVADLVRMKLTSYRLKDRVHIQDLDAAGLLTLVIEAALPELQRHRLLEIRATT
ncbi:MAG: hypothetical protein P4L56_27865 [Candidatus Sulfopaludibacter sp.]|nr:hypothetical protein [Candidatus Sulfopaludibacter sp.]